MSIVHIKSRGMSCNYLIILKLGNSIPDQSPSALIPPMLTFGLNLPIFDLGYSDLFGSRRVLSVRPMYTGPYDASVQIDSITLVRSDLI